jgi:hypothetical protein
VSPVTAFIAVGVPFVLLGSILLIMLAWRHMRSIAVRGTIVAIADAHQVVVPASSPPIGTTVTLPVVQFATEDGRQITAIAAHGAVACCVTGEQVLVRYSRRDPDDVFVPTTFNWVVLGGLVLLGVLLIVSSLAAQ